MSTKEEIDEMRELMGTLPSSDPPKTDIHVGTSGITVEMINWPTNPYQIIYENSVATWGNEAYRTKWNDTPIQQRFEVVYAALTGQTLPMVLESVQFGFIVRGASRSAFDQHARMRIGATFFSQGVRDNSRADAGFRMPSQFEENPSLHTEIEQHVLATKKLYSRILEEGQGSYQSARSILPMGITHNYKWACNMLALKGYMAQRLQACEQEDTVGVAIATWNQMNKKFPLLAHVLRPGCDGAKRCTYHQAYTMSEKFGCLFSGCGRWPDTKSYSTFNRSSASYDTIGKQMGVYFPTTTDDTWEVYKHYSELAAPDYDLFRQDML